jgi:hypothetical protein
LNRYEEKSKEDIITLCEEKFERRLAEEMGKFRAEFAEMLATMEKKFTNELANVKVELSNTRANIIKWMFIFWIGQLGAILGILFAFFK